MKLRYLALCGVFAPFVLAFTAILGGALRPGYSHISMTISELFTPGAPNKLLLDVLHSSYAVLMILFGIGVLLFVRKSENPTRGAIVAAYLLIAMGTGSFLMAAVFPQHPWGSPVTFSGMMHMLISGVISILTIIAVLLLAGWSRGSNLPAWFRGFSLVTVGVTMMTASIFVATVSTPIMGLTERIGAVPMFLWIITFGSLIYQRAGD